MKTKESPSYINKDLKLLYLRFSHLLVNFYKIHINIKSKKNVKINFYNGDTTPGLKGQRGVNNNIKV